MIAAAPWEWYVPGGVILSLFLIAFRLIGVIMRRVGDLRERVAFLEAKANGKPK